MFYKHKCRLLCFVIVILYAIAFIPMASAENYKNTQCKVYSPTFPNAYILTEVAPKVQLAGS